MSVVSPNMSIIVPVTGVDAAPAWALDIQNALFATIDAHNHAPGNGVQIQPNGLNINSDLSFQSNNAIALRTSRYTAQSSPLSGALDLGVVYVAGVDLYYNDENGNQIQLTKFGGVNGSPGSIGGLAPPASVTYVASTPAFVFQSNANTPADLDAGSIFIRNILANSKAVELNAPPALAANYSITLPASLPGSLSFVTLDSSGNLGSGPTVVGGITSTNIASNTITGANLVSNLDITTSLAIAGSTPITAVGTRLIIPPFHIGSSTTGIITSTATEQLLVGNASASVLYPVLFFQDDSSNLATRALLYGVVQANGTITSGSGFTVTANGSGSYTISFNTAFSDAPSVIANTFIDNPFLTAAAVISTSTVSFGIQTQLQNGSATVYTNLPFTFQVMGEL